MKQKKSCRMAAGLACLMALAVGAGGTLAYLTDNETHTNTFTVGEVKINLLEPSWDQADRNSDGVPDTAEDMVPNQEILKDPYVENQGDNGSLVFLRVTVPVKDVTHIADNGLPAKTWNTDGSIASTYARGEDFTTLPHKPQELFFFKKASDAVQVHKNNFNTSASWKTDADNSYWIELTDQEKFTYDLGGGSTKTDYNVANQIVGQRVYVFGYNRVLNPRDTDSVDGANIYDKTEPLFDKVQLKNILENEVASTQLQNIKVEALAIQADSVLLSGGELTGFDAMSASGKQSVLEEVYNIYVNQNGSFDDKGDLSYDRYQDAEHGAVEKEADLNNGKNLKGDELRETRIRLSVDDAVLDANTHETTNAHVTILQTGDTYTGYTFHSSDVTVATVDSAGKITAVGIGDCMVYISTNDGAYASVHISVQRDSRTASFLDADNNSSNLPQGGSE